jgi:hypothetical protein
MYMDTFCCSDVQNHKKDIECWFSNFLGVNSQVLGKRSDGLLMRFLFKEKFKT